MMIAGGPVEVCVGAGLRETVVYPAPPRCDTLVPGNRRSLGVDDGRIYATLGAYTSSTSASPCKDIV